jgi:hypothetical protein
MDDGSLQAFAALRDLVLKLQLEQVEALRSMQAALSRLADSTADAIGRLDALERRVDALAERPEGTARGRLN